MHQHMRTCDEQSQTLVAIPLFGHTKILHTLIGMGSDAFVARISRRGLMKSYVVVFLGGGVVKNFF